MKNNELILSLEIGIYFPAKFLDEFLIGPSVDVTTNFLRYRK
jgi:hypothetical protein